MSAMDLRDWREVTRAVERGEIFLGGESRSYEIEDRTKRQNGRTP